MSSSARIQDRYELGQVLGRGGMGVVYEARDTLMQRQVALKTLIEVDNPTVRELFFREWSLQASIVHPNVVEIYDIGEIEERGEKKPFFVMPLLPGVGLDELIRERSPRLTVDRVVGIFSQACRGLQAAHDRELIHRDLKPSNLFVMPDDSVKLIDFGVAHVATTSAHTTLKGTLSYMAPEQIRMGKPSVRSDIFSLGVSCFEALAGELPFQGVSDYQMSQAILSATPPAVSERNPAVNQAISQVIRRALAKEPRHRFSTARDFGAALVKALRNESVESPPQPAKAKERLERATAAFSEGDHEFAGELLAELEAEGHLDPKAAALREELRQVAKTKRTETLVRSARRFLEAEEDGLASRKVDEILELEPQHSEAQALQREIESRRDQKQIDAWLQQARHHFETEAFDESRQALARVLAERPTEEAALRLQGEIDRRESSLRRRRKEKLELYQQARTAFDEGELTNALGKLEQLLELDKDQADRPQSEEFRQFYQHVRSERSHAEAAYEHGRRLLEDGKFEEALAVCDEQLAKRPNQPLFQALKNDIEQRQRQARQREIAAIDQRLDDETELAARVAILEEALQRYPGEPHFENALQLAVEKHTLVDSIAKKIKAFEEQGRYGEALEQLAVLRSIHRRQAGLDQTETRLRERQQEQDARQARRRREERIQELLDDEAYEAAESAVRTALEDFPDDPALKDLQREVERGRERRAAAATLLDSARTAIAAGDEEEGLDRLRQARATNQRDTVVRSLLVNTLLESARTRLEDDPEDAKKRIEEALEIDPASKTASDLLTRIDGPAPQPAPDPPAAPAHATSIETNEASQPAPRKTELFVEDAEEAAAEAPAPTRLSEAPLPRPPAPQRRLGERFQRVILRVRAVTAHLPSGRKRLLLAAGLGGALIVGFLAMLAANRLFTPGGPDPSGPLTVPYAIRTAPEGAEIFVDGEPCPASPCEVDLTPGAHFIEARRIGYQAAFHRVEAPSPNPESAQAIVPEQLSLLLEPLEAVLEIVSNLESGEVRLDGEPLGQLDEGQFRLDPLRPGSHQLEIEQGRFQLSAEIEADPGRPPAVRAIFSKNLKSAFVASLGPDAVVFSPDSGVPAALDGVEAGETSEEGLELADLPTGSHEIRFGAETDLFSGYFEAGQRPVLTALLRSDRRVGTLRIVSNEDGATVLLNGRPTTRRTARGYAALAVVPGPVTVRLRKAGYRSPPAKRVEIVEGQQTVVRLDLAPESASLRVVNAPPGADVLIDGVRAGAVDSNGVFSASVSPGPHKVTLEKGLYESREFTVECQPEKVAEIGGALQSIAGILRIDVDPPNIPDLNLTLQREGESRARPIAPDQRSLTVPEGLYTIKATADDYKEFAATLRVNRGETRVAELRLERISGGLAGEPAIDLSGFARLGWQRQGGLLAQRGGNFHLLPGTERPGLYAFTALLQRGRRLEWVVDYRNDKNYVLFSFEKRDFVRTRVADGKREKLSEIPHYLDPSGYLSFRIQVESSRIVTAVRRGDLWEALDDWRPAYRRSTLGRFGFRLRSGTQVALSQFLFYPLQ